jgi:predicted nucleic acid-binding protein|tara:strand:- start:2801 stop:2962 length:162 start_codon:yes stop_codon:yes gene_type:complete
MQIEKALLLDSSAIVEHLKGNKLATTHLLEASALFVPVIVYGEWLIIGTGNIC